MISPCGDKSKIRYAILGDMLGVSAPQRASQGAGRNGPSEGHALVKVGVNGDGRFTSMTSPGELARVDELFVNAGVNIEGLCGVRTVGGQAEIHVLVEDLLPASARLRRAG